MSSVYQYRIEKDRVTLTVRLRSGRQLEGCIFVQPSVYRHFGREEPFDLFNGPEPFFPILTSDGEPRLVAKAQVVEVGRIAPTEDDHERRITSRSADVELMLVDGTRRSGSILLELPSDRPRVLDLLNSSGDQFIRLFADDSISLVNVAAVEHVRPLD
ncbi:MAG: hypothetical protein WKG32_14635 [Gemmatimonadaceae bacterium]